MTKRTQYSKEFKRQAVELLETRDKTGVAVARELGVKQNQLYKWREELKLKGDDAFKGPGRQPLEQRSGPKGSESIEKNLAEMRSPPNMLGCLEMTVSRMKLRPI